LTKSNGDIQLKKRGRKSGEELTRQVGLALKHVQELEWLEVSPLARLPAVQNLAEEKYRESAMPAGFALRSMLVDAAKIVLRDFGELPGYQRETKFLKDYLNCRSVVEISRSLGLCREHVSRSIQPRATGLVSRVFLAKANESRSI
jgi:hypothetical protein